ncbi:alpha/beta hydrolase [Thauera sp. 27]|uniref:alpha/beta hydrolase n=1 Tax=Thauera sp. 27 TaxID=305700 RepID=UPI0022B6F5F6|nr:alpha/beta hydrolase [Thauera sp. 27]
MRSLAIDPGAWSSVSRSVSEPLPRGETSFSLRCGEYWLRGRFLDGGCHRIRSVLFAIHGACSDLAALDPILYPLQAMGVSSLTCNLSGHNAASPIALEQSCLSKNLKEVLKFYQAMSGLSAVCGVSMGGALALKLAEAHQDKIEKIILVCPAIYPECAYGPAFGEPFRHAIAVPYGFMDSSSLLFLRRFSGAVLLIVGEYDGLRSSDFGREPGRSAGHVLINERRAYSAIPCEVIRAIEEAVPHGGLEKVILPDCDHGISTWLGSDETRQRWLAEQVVDFLEA